MATSSTASPVTRSAVSGNNSANAANAPWAWPMAFISCQWPNSITTMSAASSHQKSRSPHPSDAASDEV